MAIATATMSPYLEHFSEQGGPPELVSLAKLPFTIGRASDANYTIYSKKVSKFHAEIVQVGHQYALRDCNSTNGTFVNGKRTDEILLTDGDIIHIAHKEFCFRTETRSTEQDSSASQTMAAPADLPQSIIRGTKQLRDMIASQSAEIAFQPIVDVNTRAVHGYEALGRGKFPGLSRSPAVLLSLAEQCSLAVQLSQLFRKIAVEQAKKLPADTVLFLNVHAKELESDSFIDSLQDVRKSALPSQRIVIEIAESAVTSVPIMENIRKILRELDFDFAYDDFGAGQARLLELTDIPPNYLKLDMGLIQGIEQAQPRQDLVSALLKVVEVLGIKVIAEGIETETVAEICKRLGCHLGQGFLYGRPTLLA